MTFAKGLRCNGKTGVSMALNAVLELYAGKLARTVLRGPRFREGTWLPFYEQEVVKVFRELGSQIIRSAPSVPSIRGSA